MHFIDEEGRKYMTPEKDTRGDGGEVDGHGRWSRGGGEETGTEIVLNSKDTSAFSKTFIIINHFHYYLLNI